MAAQQPSITIAQVAAAAAAVEQQRAEAVDAAEVRALGEEAQALHDLDAMLQHPREWWLTNIVVLSKPTPSWLTRFWYSDPLPSLGQTVQQALQAYHNVAFKTTLGYDESAAYAYPGNGYVGYHTCIAAETQMVPAFVPLS
jgi:hypothetical protein